ncbi:GNAT family N-acetyltransferase [Amnibacterium setariae]|uniref:GNAT family N-acetyltransferase n=1 Tax=Amnibacterium setariae TaxID=2306585 RepID=A0A3A1U0Y2_9MICO|nr:GNAT family N-acetyltransferase [Amnibacterium setariae]RIX28585.1 GNAT family N-acetyltransferase [Amnibacterium setariae]
MADDAASAIDPLPLLENYRSYFTGWGLEGRGGGPVTTFRSGIASAALNAVTGNAAPVSEALPVARRRLRGVPWLWDVAPDAAPGTAADLEALGGRRVGGMPVMAVQAEDVRRLAVPPGGAQARVVDVVEDVPGWTTAWMPAMGLDLRDRAALLRVDRDRVAVTGRLTRFGAMVDGAFRATAELHLTGTVGGVYLVATEEGHRGRGLATLLVAAAVGRAVADGAEVLTLQASSAGESVYRRLGFETVARIERWLPPEEPA